MSGKQNLAFGKKNYRLMLIGIGLLIVGFIVMTLDDTKFGFGFFGLTLGPILIMAGYIVEIVAILQKPEKREKE